MPTVCAAGLNSILYNNPKTRNYAYSFRNWYTARLTIRATKDRAALSNKDKDSLQGLLNPIPKTLNTA